MRRAALLLLTMTAVACAVEEPGQDEAPIVEAPSGGKADEVVTPDEQVAGAQNDGMLDELDACRAVVDTFIEHANDMGCVATIASCPDLLSKSFGVACMQYRAASITSCVDTILATQTCADLEASSCSIKPVWGTEPLGCPEG